MPTRTRRILTASLVAALACSIPLSSGASSSNPNADANPRCAFGPGKARWDIKTSVPSGAIAQQPTELAIEKFIHAPDLLATQLAIENVHRNFAGSTGSMSVKQSTLTAASSSATKPFAASVKWSSPATPFTLQLPAISPVVVAKANSFAAVAQASGEAAPTQFFALLTAQLDDQRLPDPVEIGDVSVSEGQTVTTSGTVVASTCEKDDGDFHIDLGDGTADECAVVEVPNPYYIRNQQLSTLINKAEATAKSLQVGEHITVTGQLFYDTVHGGGSDPGGGRGKGHCAQSLWEIHPVFEIQSD